MPATIDSDGHVNETGHLGDYIESKYKDVLSLPPWELQVPMAPDVRPMETWDPDVFGNLGLAGGHDPHARLLDMDTEGIDKAVLYPTLLLAFRPDPGEFGALCRAYNNWLADYCRAAPDRLFGVAVVPLQDPPAAIAEMERAVQQLDLRPLRRSVRGKRRAGPSRRPSDPHGHDRRKRRDVVRSRRALRRLQTERRWP